ncbi:MAG: type II toxin-antitoxin system antitoxin DNA ADP-ribosyl glycohydrolase DarG [Candidatus Omnitrophota bacterium]
MNKVKVLTGDLFTSKYQTWVNTVNCVGVMGKGVALEFKKRFPDMFAEYESFCKEGKVKLGHPYLHKRMVAPWILNFPTKNHWRQVANLNDIIKGLEYLLKYYKAWGIESLAVPPLGCGSGQLEWRVVGPTLFRYLSKMDIPIELYAPHGTPHEELQPIFLNETERRPYADVIPDPKYIRPEWVALVDIINRIEAQPYHWPIGATMFQKVAYIATEEGLNTGFEYRKGSFGPYASEVKSMISRLVNNGLIIEERLGRMLRIRPGKTFEDARKAYEKDLKPLEGIISKTTDLFLRLNTHQSEVVATVVFAERQLRYKPKTVPSERQVFNDVMKWKIRRRPPLSEEEVADTIRNLAALGWLNVTASDDLPVSKEEEFVVSLSSGT